MLNPPAPPSGTSSAGKSVLKAGSACFIVAIIAILAQPIVLAFVYGPMAGVCIVLAIIAIAKDQVRRGLELLLATIFILPVFLAISIFGWAAVLASIGGSVADAAARSHSTESSASAIHSPTPEILSTPTPLSLASLKDRFLDQIRAQPTVSIADFRTDQEIEIELQSEANFDFAKAKKAALTIAKEWQKLSGQPEVTVSIWKEANLLAKESVP